ncbi:MAG: TetR/AcrR family transcriptional regulator [Bacteroidales bacterium]|jgi:AcrR family transcriptional regulator|nr:TetR/AcrR family transcriptional regulator [Bacteroidales bacterium]
MEKEEKQKVYLERCWELFGAKGLKISTDEISKYLNISKRTLYELFENKDTLLDKCLMYAVYSMLSKIDNYCHTAEQEDVIDKMFIIIRMQTTVKADALKKMMTEIKTLYPNLFKKYDAILDEHLRNFLHDCIEEGKKQKIFLPFLNADIICALLVSRHNESVLLNLHASRKYTIGEIMTNTIYPFLRGMCTELGVSKIETNISKHGKYFMDNVIKKIEDNL